MSRLRYGVASRRVWGDARFRALSAPQPNGRDLWLYYLLNPHASRIPGVIVERAETGAAELQWPARGFFEAFKEIEALGMAVADWRSGLVWLPKAVRHDPPCSPNHVRSYGKAWLELPDSGLLADIHVGLQAELQRINVSFVEIFREATSSRELSKPFESPDASSPLFRSRSLPLPRSLPTADAVAHAPTHAPAPTREEQPLDQSNGSNGSAKPNGGPIRCPIDLKLDDDQLGTLEINNGCKRDDGLKLCAHFAAKWRHNDPQPLASWQRALWTAVVSAWQNPAERSRILPAPGLLEHEENTRALPSEERERLRAWRAEQDAQRAAGGK